MLIGLSTYTYTWSFGVAGNLPEKPMTLYDLVDKAIKMDADCIQIADNYPLPELNRHDLGEIRNYALQNKILVEVGGRGMTEDNLQYHIGLAAYFGSPVVRMVIDGPNYLPDYNTILSVIRNALKQLRQHNIVLALENHDRFPSSWFRQLVEKINDPCVGICLDCVNSLGIGEGIETVAENLAPYTVNLHVKDFLVKRVAHKMGFVVEGTPAGKGFLDLQNLYKNLKHHGRCKSAILELWTPPAENVAATIQCENDWAEESIIYMKKIFQT